MMLLVSCSTTDDRAVSNGKDEMRARYAVIKHALQGEFHATDMNHAVNSGPHMFGEIYASSWNGTTAEWRIRLRATGRDPYSIGEHTVSLGTCIKVRGSSARFLKESTIRCPEPPSDEPEKRFDVATDIFN
jgi:hypothetical protein